MSYNHITYMRDSAEKCKDILHDNPDNRFHRISGLMMLEEFLDNISNNQPGKHLLVEEDLNGQLIGDDNHLDRQNYMFFIVQQVDVNDHDARETAKKECVATAKKIIARMRKHWYEANKGITDTYGLKNFDTNNIFYQTIGPVGDNAYGVEVRFSIIEPAGTVYNVADWNE